MNQRYFVLLFMAWFCGLALAITHLDDRKAQGTPVVMPTKLHVVNDRGELADNCMSHPGQPKASHHDDAPVHDRDMRWFRARPC